jgi:hypothetical protein
VTFLPYPRNTWLVWLHNAATYRVTDDRLDIEDADGETTLVFARIK